MAKQRLGRPPKPEGTTLPETLQIRLNADDKAQFYAAAAKAGISVSEWMRDRLAKAANREARQN